MLGELLRSTRRTGSAEGLFKQAIDGLEGLGADYPGVPRYKKHLARLYDVLSTLYCATDRFPESVEARRWATSLDPLLHEGQQVLLNNLAWYLVTAPNHAARNPSRALELAMKAVELAPRSWASWNTLGVARYRNGDWEAARETLMSALEKNSGDNAFDCYFLAMTLWRLGQRQVARQWLERAEEWRLRNRPDDIELLRFRTEAEQLVGPFGGCLARTPPPAPSSVAEALKDPSFGLPKLCPLGDTNRTELGERTPSRPPWTDGPALHALDVLDHSLFFIDLT